MRLVHSVNFLIQFTVIFVVTSILLTIKHIFMYLSKMFDLPTSIIQSMIELKIGRDKD